MDFTKETALIETILFLESEPVAPKVLAQKAQLSDEVTEKCLEILKERLNGEESGLELSMITGGYCLTQKKNTGMFLKNSMAQSATENFLNLQWKLFLLSHILSQSPVPKLNRFVVSA